MAGSLRIRITAADPTRLIAEMNLTSIDLQDVISEDMLTVTATIPRVCYPTAKRLVEKRGGEITALYKSGLYWDFKRLLFRPYFLLGLITILGLTLFLPTRVLFVQVNGNSSIPTRLILEKAESCGIGFGASRQEVRSEQLKNKLLSEIPQLQWAGINTTGCVATITVRERRDSNIQEPQTGVSSIIAARDGIIEELTVTKGNPLCQVGQAVKQGQILVSGYTDCGIAIKASQAEAEVYAKTRRDVAVTALQSCVQKSKIIERRPFLYLIVGKAQYAIYGGELPAATGSCVWQKISQEHILTLPGGYALPVKVITGEYICYQADSLAVSTLEEDLINFAKNYVGSQMVSGRIINAAHFIRENKNLRIMQVDFSCVEMIGKVRWESTLPAP